MSDNEPPFPSDRNLDNALEQTLAARDFEPSALLAAAQATVASPGTNEGSTQKDSGDTFELTATLKGFGDTSVLPSELQDDQNPAITRFEVIEQIGKGATSRVYAVRDNGLGRTVAVKFLRGQGTLEKGARERFLHEAHITATLEHPNIMPIHDIGLSDDRRMYFTMKHVRGISVGDAIRLLRENKVVPEEFRTIEGRLRIIHKVCDGLALAHDHGYVHQDIKPDNIMLGNYGEVLLLDWGSALSNSRSFGLTDSGMYGTPAYMSPEQARRERVDIRSDIYCVGATLFHMLTLAHPLRARDVQTFWDMKCRGELSPLPDSAKSLPSPLIELLIKAMAPQPQERFGSARQLQVALVEYMDHAESLRAAELAIESLGKESPTENLSDISHVIIQLEQSLKIWPQNQLASQGLDLASRLYAQRALEQQEYRIVESFCAGKPHLRDFAEKAKAALCHKAAEQRRLRTVRFGLIGTLCVIGLLLVLFGREYYRQFGRWQKIAQYDFSHRSMPDTTIQRLNYDWDTFIGDAVFGDFGLNITAGAPLWLNAIKEPGDIRIDIEMQWEGNIDGFEININADLKETPRGGACPIGYSCQFGGYSGSVTYICRNSLIAAPSIANGIYVPFKVGRPYRLRFQRIGDLLSLHVNGKQVHSSREPLPLAAKTDGSIVLRSWNLSQIRSITVWRLALAEKTSPVSTGDALLARGFVEEALDEYVRTAQAHKMSQVGQNALLRGALLAATLPASQDSASTEVYRHAVQRLKRPEDLQSAMEAEAIRRWRIGLLHDAFRLADSIYARFSQSRCALHFLSVSRPRLDAADAQKLLTLIAHSSDLGFLDINSLGIEDLSPLSNLKLVNLIASRNRIQDLSALKGMPLTNLNLDRNLVEDLTPLKEMPLTRLEVGRNKVSSLDPLKGIGLVWFSANGNKITDLSPLTGEPLIWCALGANRIHSIEPLRGLPLRMLEIDHNFISSLEPLVNTPLVVLRAQRNPISSVSALKGAPLEVLNIGETLVSDLTHLTKSPLASLGMSGTPVTSLDPLNGLPLATLDMAHTPVLSLEPLAQCASLRELILDYSAVTSLEPLAGLQLQRITLRGIPVDDLTPLEGQPLMYVYAENTMIATLAPLAQAPLVQLSTTGSPLTSIEPFGHRPPPQFSFYSPHISKQEAQNIALAWENQGFTDNAEAIRTLYAVNTGNITLARSLATPWQTSRYLWVGFNLPFTSADSLARSLGAHLVTTQTKEEFLFVNEFAEAGSGYWLGMDSTGATWVTGEPVQLVDLYEIQKDAPLPGHRYAVGKRELGWLRSVIPGQTMRMILEWDN